MLNRHSVSLVCTWLVWPRPLSDPISPVQMPTLTVPSSTSLALLANPNSVTWSSRRWNLIVTSCFNKIMRKGFDLNWWYSLPWRLTIPLPSSISLFIIAFSGSHTCSTHDHDYRYSSCGCNFSTIFYSSAPVSFAGSSFHLLAYPASNTSSYLFNFGSESGFFITGPCSSTFHNHSILFSGVCLIVMTCLQCFIEGAAL